KETITDSSKITDWLLFVNENDGGIEFFYISACLSYLVFVSFRSDCRPPDLFLPAKIFLSGGFVCRRCSPAGSVSEVSAAQASWYHTKDRPPPQKERPVYSRLAAGNV
ncbi:MAG: hypothetical protein IJG83_00995, partial [Thermoguttaceae bacterium]|nr:hypothetical protein [Thermoguttaceae bacterium]